MSKENSVREKHPSFGMIRFSRRSGGDGKLFGSSIEHCHTVSVTISQAEHIRDDLKYDRYMPDGDIVEVEMSPSQFAEAIMSMNTQGTPCTIRRIKNNKGEYRGVEACPLTDKRAQFEKEFQGDLRKLAKKLDTLMSSADELLDKKTLNKGDRDLLKSKLRSIKQDLTDDLPFVLQMFNEQVEKTVTEAKSAVEAFTESKLRSAGLGAMLDAGNPMLVNIPMNHVALPAPEEE